MTDSLFKFISTRFTYILLALFILVIVILLGLMFGYSVLGDGNALDVLNPSKFSQIFDKLK